MRCFIEFFNLNSAEALDKNVVPSVGQSFVVNDLADTAYREQWRGFTWSFLLGIWVGGGGHQLSNSVQSVVQHLPVPGFKDMKGDDAVGKHHRLPEREDGEFPTEIALD